MTRLFTLIMFISIAAVPALADLSPIKIESKFNSLVPSCEMLAWRWVNSISRIAEAGALREELLAGRTNYQDLMIVASRLPQGDSDGSNESVLQEVEFEVPNVTPQNFKILEMETAGIAWKNSTANTTDRLDFAVTSGNVKIMAKMTYADYCFYPGKSWVDVQVGAQRLRLSWAGVQTDISKYLELLR